MMNQDKTPLYDALVGHNKKGPLSLHVPGHKNGLIYEDNPYFQRMLSIDVTELTGLDDLHSPEGVILEAEKLLAEAYKAKRSFFLVNGSTVGNLAMMLATIQEGDIVYIQRNCHKSILNGVMLTKAQPVLLGPEYHEEWGVAGGVSIETVRNAYREYPNCKAIILTYPNYYGMTYELEEIIQFAHDNDIPVLVDEAHGAHFIGGEYFPMSAIELGADVVVQSAHKTLPAMTMGSYLHVNSDYISSEMVHHYVRILQSSSPSYPIMASLDFARKYIATYTREDENYLRETIKEFRRELDKINFMKVLTFPNQLGDPLKLTIQTESSYTGYELQRLFEEKGIFTEMADPYNVLLVLPLLKKDMYFPFEEILSLIKEIKIPKQIRNHEPQYFNKKSISTLKRNSSYKERNIPLDESVGYICAKNIIPYPPGVPFLLRGEEISKEDIQGLKILMKTGAKFQGGEILTAGMLTVFCKLEDNHD
jgi:arginine/lysine/ornithine decarboxylase